MVNALLEALIKLEWHERNQCRDKRQSTKHKTDVISYSNSHNGHALDHLAIGSNIWVMHEREPLKHTGQCGKKVKYSKNQHRNQDSPVAVLKTVETYCKKYEGKGHKRKTGKPGTKVGSNHTSRELQARETTHERYFKQWQEHICHQCQ